MCAGKNRAAEILARKGFAVVDADIVAHEALEAESGAVIGAFAAIAKARGISLVGSDGSIDRRALASIVFSDPSLLARHEALIYPKINEILNNYIEEHRNCPAVINAPLLHKSPILDRCDFVIFVDAWVPIRLFRGMRRDNLPILQLIRRFRAQKHLFAQYLEKNVDIQRVRNEFTVGVLEKGLSKLLSIRGY